MRIMGAVFSHGAMRASPKKASAPSRFREGRSKSRSMTPELGLRIRWTLLPRRYDLFAELGAAGSKITQGRTRGTAESRLAAILAIAAVLVVQALRREISVRTDAGSAARETDNCRELVRLPRADGTVGVCGRDSQAQIREDSGGRPFSQSLVR